VTVAVIRARCRVPSPSPSLIEAPEDREIIDRARSGWLALESDVGARDDELSLVQWSGRREGGPHGPANVTSEDMTHESTAWVVERARAQAFHQPCETLAEGRNPRIDGFGEGLI